MNFRLRTFVQKSQRRHFQFTFRRLCFEARKIYFIQKKNFFEKLLEKQKFPIFYFLWIFVTENFWLFRIESNFNPIDSNCFGRIVATVGENESVWNNNNDNEEKIEKTSQSFSPKPSFVLRGLIKIMNMTEFLLFPDQLLLFCGQCRC